MTLPIDSQTPLALVSEFRSRINAKSNAPDVDSRLLSISLQVSQLFQAACKNRFDEFVETRGFTPFHISMGGDLFGLRELRLDMTLKSTPANTIVTNGDASLIATGNMQFLPVNNPFKSVIRLNPYGVQFWYHAGVTDPVGSITVNGTWGRGGGWVNTGATVQNNYTAGSLTLDTGAVQLEAGMVLQLDQGLTTMEQLYVSAVGGTTPNFTATVTGAFNGTTANNHAATGVIYRWKPMAAVQQCIIRLLEVVVKQDDNPLYGQQIIGDMSLISDVQSWPKDVIFSAQTCGLAKPQRIQGV